jgi:drug/metabolite transporter (DMT)-like permease
MAGIQIGIAGRRLLVPTLGLGALFVACWSSGFIGAKLGAAEAPPTTVLMWRFVLLALLLAPFLHRRGKRACERRGRDLWRQIAVGGLSQSGYLLTVYWAIGLGVSTGTTALIDGIQPLVVAALAGPVLGTAVPGRQWIGLLLGLLAVVLVTGADAAAPGTQAPGWAYLVPFTGMFCLVAATFLDRRAVSATPPMRALAIHCTTSAVVFTVLAGATGSALVPASARFWLAVAWLVAFSTLGGYGLYWYLLGRLGVTNVNTLMFLVPPVTTLWGAAVFGEPFTVATGAGLAVALAATWMVTRSAGTVSRRRAGPRPSARRRAPRASPAAPRWRSPAARRGPRGPRRGCHPPSEPRTRPC